MLRIFLVALLGAYLIVIGLWPPAIAPISLGFAGLAAAIGAIPGPVLVLLAVIAWLKHRPARPATT